MTDAHVHLEKGDYTIECIEQFIDYAIKRNIDDVPILTASDAHSPRYIGLYIKEMNGLIQSVS